MTPERFINLAVAALPIIVAVLAALFAFIKWYVDRRDKLKAPPAPLELVPATGITVPDVDHADDAIDALKESRDQWKARAELAERKLSAQTPIMGDDPTGRLPPDD